MNRWRRRCAVTVVVTVVFMVVFMVVFTVVFTVSVTGWPVPGLSRFNTAE
ncbi:MAG: hypothetical protein IIC13_08000 [SAR324 cluster bacterium]|nr:hypothetical protein [SAR324 cluster bacterium]